MDSFQTECCFKLKTTDSSLDYLQNSDVQPSCDLFEHRLVKNLSKARFIIIVNASYHSNNSTETELKNCVISNNRGA